MKVEVTTVYNMEPVQELLRKKGLDKNGAVQKQLTNIVNRRITRYMPYLTGTLSTRRKRITGPDEITILGRYSRYQYFGKVMVGKAPRVATNKPLHYTTTFHPKAGPYWDRWLVAAEKDAIVQELQEFVDTGGGA